MVEFSRKSATPTVDDDRSSTACETGRRIIRDFCLIFLLFKSTMSISGRPTWTPAIGAKDQGGNRVLVPSLQVSVKDQKAHTKLKFRFHFVDFSQAGQDSAADMQDRDLRAELEEKERKSSNTEKRVESRADLQLPEPKKAKYEMDADDSESSSEESSGSSSDSDSEYEDTAELLRELEKIKAER
jgi:hypothetical protein